MRRRHSRFGVPALSVVLAVVLAACGDRGSTPTQPRARADILAPSASSLYCSSNLASTISSEINAAFKNNTTVSKTASALFGDVKKACNTPSDSATVRAKAMIYLKYFTQHIQDVSTSVTPTREQFDVTHVNHVFEYAGWPDPNLYPKSFTSAGGVTVCGANAPFAPKDANGNYVLANPATLVDCFLVPAAGRAALIVGANAIPDDKDHLFALAPIADASCSVNRGILRYVGPCYDYSVNPVTNFVGPNFATNAICTSEFLGSIPASRSQLLHPFGTAGGGYSGTQLATKFEGAFFANTFNLCDGGVSTATLSPSGDNAALAWLDRLATRAVGLVIPRDAYAYHVPSIGSSGGYSPWSAVDPAIFYSDFEDMALGTFPAFWQLDRGTWVDTVTAPGTITVQSNFADMPGQSAVLNQGGGNCTACGQLKLVGTVADGVAATLDYWQVAWTSVQTKPSVKAAPFVIRGTGTDTVGVLSYRTDATGDHLYYNGVQVASWVTGVSQRFTVTLNLATQMAQLCIYGRTAGGFTLQYPSVTPSPCPADPGSAQTAFPGATQNATTGAFTFVTQGHSVALYRFNAEFSGIDSGVMGLDNVILRRMEEPLP